MEISVPGGRYRKLTAKRDAAAALRFFRKAIRHHDEPEVVTIDKSGASTAALVTLNAGKPDEETITVRQSKYLNNLIEQDHRNIKRRIKLMPGFKSFRRMIKIVVIYCPFWDFNSYQSKINSSRYQR